MTSGRDDRQTGRRGIRARLEATGHRLMRRMDHASVPKALRSRWRAAPASADAVWVERLRRDRTEILPWLDNITSLRGARVLEIGSGRGASTFALTEAGADVTGVDVNPKAIAYATRQLESAGLRAAFNVLNVTELDELRSGPFDLVLFWASLEHMTSDERSVGLRSAWSHLAPGGSLAIIETPNRLWPLDSHTSELAFFNWLPDEVAFAYAANSPRKALGSFTDTDAQMLDFRRLGRGVSYHDLELALGRDLEPISCMQLERRDRNPIRRLAWSWSSAGSTERALRRFAPERHRAWFQPFLYLALRKLP